MTFKLFSLQFGKDADSTKCFGIERPAVPDGSISIFRGKIGAKIKDVLKINPDGGVNTFGPLFSAYMGAATLSAVNATNTKIPINTIESDTANCFNIANNRFQPNVAGWYSITGAVVWGLAGTGDGFCSIHKNNTEVKRGNVARLTGNTTGVMTVTGLVYLNGTTDYVELIAYQSSGGPLNMLGSSPSTGCYFQGHLARAA